MEIIPPGQYTEQPALVRPVLSKSAGLDDLQMSLPTSTILQRLYSTQKLVLQKSVLTLITMEYILTAVQESSGVCRKYQSPSTGSRAERPPYTNRYCSPMETDTQVVIEVRIWYATKAKISVCIEGKLTKSNSTSGRYQGHAFTTLSPVLSLIQNGLCRQHQCWSLSSATKQYQGKNKMK